MTVLGHMHFVVGSQLYFVCTRSSLSGALHITNLSNSFNVQSKLHHSVKVFFAIATDSFHTLTEVLWQSYALSLSLEQWPAAQPLTFTHCCMPSWDAERPYNRLLLLCLSSYINIRIIMLPSLWAKLVIESILLCYCVAWCFVLT